MFFRSVFFLTLVLSSTGQTVVHRIPAQLVGKWTVRRIVPTRTISCWGAKESRRLIGTQIEYDSDFFRWRNVSTHVTHVRVDHVTAEEFHDENSGGGAADSQVSFGELGIKSNSIEQLTIEHPAANLTGATIEIPGDRVMLKDPTTIIFSVCNVYFEAKRRM
jgi:hypothetical protein